MKYLNLILNFLITYNLIIGKSISNNTEEEIKLENVTEKYEPK